MALSFCNAPRYIESDMFPGKKRLNAKQISTNPKQQTIELKVRKIPKGNIGVFKSHKKWTYFSKESYPSFSKEFESIKYGHFIMVIRGYLT